MTPTTPPQRFTLRAAVYLILNQDGRLLLIRRHNTGWQDGMYTLPAGHVDGGETIAATMAREAYEEVGVLIRPEHLHVVHVVHHVSDREYIDFYLRAETWQGTPTITEPDKCDDLLWCSPTELPASLLPNVRAMLANWAAGKTFSEYP